MGSGDPPGGRIRAGASSRTLSVIFTATNPAINSPTTSTGEGEKDAASANRRTTGTASMRTSPSRASLCSSHMLSRKIATGRATAAPVPLGLSSLRSAAPSTATARPAPMAAAEAKTGRCPYPHTNAVRVEERSRSVGKSKYSHHMENKINSPPAMIASSSPVSSASLLDDWMASEAARIDSPSTMMVNKPYRSAMWPGSSSGDEPG
jgi:hypothetical protein